MSDTTTTTTAAAACARHAEHVGPGKFENASCAVYALFSAGDADRSEDLPDGGYWIEIQLTASDREMFPELGDQTTLRIFEDTYGSVSEVSWEPEPDALAAELPEDDDLMTDGGNRFWHFGGNSPSLPGLTVPLDETDWRPLVRAYFERVQFWPNVWSVSDHGNLELLTV